MKEYTKVLVILGPTATGKTDLALNLAKRFNGELVACDSRQVYKGLDIGTGKMPGSKAKVEKSDKFWRIDGVRVWMYDVADPQIQYTVANYVKDANKVINDLLMAKKTPIVVGGTGLYLRALLEGIPNLDIPVDSKLREQLQVFTKEKLQQKLKTLSMKRWKQMNGSDRQNPRRLLRSIELLLMNPYTNKVQKPKFKAQKYNLLKIGLTAPRDELYKRVDLRILKRIKEGMIEEAAKLHKEGLSLTRMESLGLEYNCLSKYISGEVKTKEELISMLKGKIHGYVRRQLTWFSKEKDVLWFDITGANFLTGVEKEVELWYHQGV